MSCFRKIPIQGHCKLVYATMLQRSSLSNVATICRQKLYGPLLASQTRNRKCLCTQVIPPPVLEGETKEFSPKIQQIVEDISKLTLIEVADLNDLLKSTLKITDAPVMAMGAMPQAAAVEEDDEPEVKQVKSLFTVKLTKFDPTKKVALIKEIKGQIEGMNLVQAKKFVESLPQTVRSDVTKDEAEALKTSLEAIGAAVEID